MDFLSNKLNKYSIRKFTVGTSSILIGSLIFLGNPTDVEAEETKQSTSTTETAKAPPTTELPTTEVPTTEAPTTEEPTTEAPTTEEPTTEAPTTEEPTTEAPTTEEPTTEAPTTEEPTTEAPTTEEPTTEAPTTEEPTTEKPVSEITVKEAVTNVEKEASTVQEREALLTSYVAEATGTSEEAAKANLSSLNLDYANLTNEEVLAALLAAVANEQDKEFSCSNTNKYHI